MGAVTDPVQVHVLVPDREGRVAVVDVDLFTDRLSTEGVTLDQAVEYAAIDRGDPSPPFLHRVWLLNETGDGDAYWSKR